MNIQQCPHCGIRVMPKADGTCPSCQRTVPSEAAPKSAPAARPTAPLSADVGSPYASPLAVEMVASNEGQRPLFRQAGALSVLCPLLGCAIAWAFGDAYQSESTIMRTAPSFTVFGLIGTGFLLSLFAVVNGLMRRRPGTVVLGVIGLLISGGIIAMALYIVSLVMQRVAD